MVNTPSEDWKVCFESYEISNHGNCRRKLKDGRYAAVKGSILKRGYRYFQVQRDGRRINKLFHHLVAEQFIGPRPCGLVIDHIDRCKTNNNAENLRYITQLENSRNTDRYRVDLPSDPVARKRAMREEYEQRKMKRLF